MNQVTVMFKKEDVAEVGGYIDWYCEEDYYLWIRMLQKGSLGYNLQEPLRVLLCGHGRAEYAKEPVCKRRRL